MEEVRGKESPVDMEQVTNLHSARTGVVIVSEVIMVTPQKVVSHSVNLHTHKELQDLLQDERDSARINSLGLVRAEDWLNAIPVCVLGLKLRIKEFRVSVQYRLSMKVFSGPGPCTSCHCESDEFGEGEQIAPHNHLRDALLETARQASLGPSREERVLLPGNNDRPAYVFLPGWSAGRDAELEVTVVSPL